MDLHEQLRRGGVALPSAFQQYDPDWCPPGGTSRRRVAELSHDYETAFLQELKARVAERGQQIWLKEYQHGTSVAMGWRDDPEGGYYVGFGLRHDVSWPEDTLPSFSYLSYTRDSDGRRDPCLGERDFEPPYARDVALQVACLLAWMDAHRRTLGLPDTTTDAAL